MADYWELYKKVKSFYFKLGKIICPALDGEEIIFSRRGFRHMLNKNGSRRIIPDQIRRFKMILNIGNILPNARLDKSNRAGFIRLLGEYDGKQVRIVVLNAKDGRKHFISIQ